MKIVMAPHSYLPIEAGTELYVYNLTKEYVRLGHKVIVITGREPYFRRGGLPWHEKIKGVDVYRYHMDFPRFGREYPWFGLRSCLQFLFDLPINIVRQARLLKKFDPDIINIFFLWSQAFYLLFTKRWARKASWVISPLGPNDVLDDTDPKSSIWMSLRKRILKKADKVHCGNYTMKNAVTSLGVSEEKCEWIPLGVDTDRFKPIDMFECRRKLNLPIDRKIVLYISRLWKNKGVLEYLEACRQLVKKDEDTVFYLLGEGKLRHEIESKVLEYELNDRFIMLGKKPYEELPLWINACDMMICINLYDSLSKIHFDSLACGTPVIAAGDWETVHNFVPEVHGLFVKAGDVSELINAIENGLNMNWDNSRISRDWSMNSWFDISQQMISMYRHYI